MMKKILILVLLFSLQSCFFSWMEPVDNYSEYEPVLMERANFETSISLQNSRTIDNAGKIYVYNNYLFINEKNLGFHVFNNQNPESPVALKFITSPGATDMAIKNNVVYINQATDLVAVELSTTIQSLNVSKRIENIFPEMISPDGFYFGTPEGKVIVNWKKKN